MEPVSPAFPLDILATPLPLDGSAGSNRGVAGLSRIAANNDVEAVRAWLARFHDTPTTFDNYRKEAERLLLWSTLQLGKPLSSLTHEDFLVYQRFLADPQPREKWVGGGGRKHGRRDPRWRPFHGPLGASSQRQAMVILNSMLAWLVEAGYLRGNPLSLSRHRARRAKPRVTRYLTDEMWGETLAYIAEMEQETPAQRARQARARWLFTLLYLGGLRISEVAGNTMGCFYARRDSAGRERWWLEILGKGRKERLVPATSQLMTELQRYRLAVGLPARPATIEDTPLVLPLGKSRKPLTRSALHLTVKTIFEGAADRLRARGGEDAEGAAEQMEAASAHWLRHTAGSHMANHEIDLRVVRDNLGHESLSTTSLYLHTEDDARHQQTEDKHRIHWQE